ncbi:MAG: glycosyltransferase [Candidatus Accumulibacter sp.]|uniref:Glycosyltransferase n=1 Tax=Candidatus Accumulibacter affinis TaxID=2954384 RepID=A0A935TER9_9PROT|nr:glycosyltransferase [Candidatus Accumulibacter affinis]
MSTLGSPARMLSIAFLAGNRNPGRFQQDPSFVYRCENLGLALQAMGHRVSWLHWSDLGLRQRFDVVVFHRPRFSLLWRAFLWTLRRHGTTLVADVDDLVFDPLLAQHSPGVLNGLVTLPKINQQFAKHSAALTCFERVTVSTQTLAAHVQRCFPGVESRVLPNAVHMAWRAARRGHESRLHQPVVTYFPGTRSHDRDFSLYAEGVERFLTAHSDARFEVTGPLRFALQARAGQVVHHEKVPFAHYAERVRAAWVNLAPLESTAFTRCKSALKVLEAGFWGKPTVCSPLPDAERFTSAGAVFASDSPACFAALQALLVPANYAAITQGLSARVVAQADARQVAESFLQFVGARPGVEA